MTIVMKAIAACLDLDDRMRLCPLFYRSYSPMRLGCNPQIRSWLTWSKGACFIADSASCCHLILCLYSLHNNIISYRVCETSVRICLWLKTWAGRVSKRSAWRGECTLDAEWQPLACMQVSCSVVAAQWLQCWMHISSSWQVDWIYLKLRVVPWEDVGRALAKKATLLVPIYTKRDEQDVHTGKSYSYHKCNGC